ncbi:MAG TPA: serine/threonine-protein kinase [Gemmatimonadaceae bacterium]|nr:serine/threonine-protein kinase [Gemmatimonadaceae bacterium]
MSEIDWPAVAEIFADALELPPEQRSAFVAERCGDRPEMHAAVTRMLVAREEAPPQFLAGVRRDLLDEVAGATPSLERAGPWRLIREIGHGGMGRVFLAERADAQFDQKVAVKLLKRGMDSDAILARFLRERQILAGLDHPNIARLLDGGIAEDGRPYFVMEYVDGEAITAYADARRLSIDARLALFRTVCLAVEYAHRNLVVHRDLKPSNILVTTDGRPKLLDFGIAKLLASPDDKAEAATLTSAGVRLLTPDYAAPEQFHGDPITTATDVYGLGAVLYHLLAGLPPVDARARKGAERGPDTDPVPVSTAPFRPVPGLEDAPSPDAVAALRSTDATRLRRRLSGDLDVIVATALRVTPDRRYASVGALHDDIRRHLERLPVRARPDTLGYRTSRFVRRHRAVVVAAGVVATLLVAFGISTAMQARALERERDRARLEAAAAREVSEFLVGVFEVADPMTSAPGNPVSASDLLDRGARRIESELAGQAAVQARLLGVIGRAYANLQRTDRAEPLLARAVELQRTIDGSPSPAVGAALHQLARVRMQGNSFPEAAAALREALAIQRDIEPEGAAVWGLFIDLAYVLHASGDNDGGRAMEDSATALFGRLTMRDFGESHAELRRVADLLRRSRPPMSNYADSVFSRLVAVEQATAGENSAPVAAALTAWASAKARRREYATTDSMLDVAVRMYRATEPASVAEANALNQQAMIVLQTGDAARAESLAREALRILIARLGPDHREVAIMRLSLTFALQRLGRIDEAIEMSRLANATFERNANDAVAILPPNQWDLALMLRGAGRMDEALGEFARALHTLETRFPPDHMVTATVRRDYGAALVDAGRPAEAAPMLEKSIDVLSARWGAEDARVDGVRISLGRALAALGRRAEARRMLVGVVDRLAAKRGATDVWTRRAQAALESVGR